MLYLIVSIVAISAVACLFRQSMLKGAAPLGFNAVFRITAALLYFGFACATLNWSDLPQLFAATAVLGLIAALFFWISGFASLKVAQLGPIGIGWTVLRCSMIIPTLASLLHWHEVTTETPVLFAARLAGMAIATVAIIFFGRDRLRLSRAQPDRHKTFRAWCAWLAVAFCAQGAWEICLRATRELLHDNQARILFLAIVFIASGLFSLPTMRISGARIGRKELFYGSVAALISAIGSGFRPWALRELDGAIVFPVTTISVIILVQLAGMFFWREKISRWTVLAFILATSGILLLTLKF